MAYELGYFIGDGNRTKSGISLTCGDEAHARYLACMIGQAGVVALERRSDSSAGRVTAVERPRSAWSLPHRVPDAHRNDAGGTWRSIACSPPSLRWSGETRTSGGPL